MPEKPAPSDPPPSGEPVDVRAAALEHASGGPLRILSLAAVGLFVLAACYALSVATALFMPVVIAFLLNFLLTPMVRALERLRVPVPLGAAFVLVGLVGAVALGLYYLSGPAAAWIEEVPDALRQVEYELRGLTAPVEEATQQVQNLAAGGGGEETQTVQVERATLSTVLLSQTTQFLAGAVIVFFLLYFLLASGDLFLRKLVHVLPMFRRKRIAVQIVHGIEHDLSRYLFTYAIINAVLGTVVGFGLYLLGMPNPALWGLMVGVLNFMPYLGPLVGVTILGLVAFVSFESTAKALAAPALYFTINALEGNLVTPLVMGQQLRLNPVAIFLSLIFWGWLWGVAGALLAVPLLVTLKIVCDNVATMAPLAEFLGR